MSSFSLPWMLFSAYLVVELFTRGAILRWLGREALHFLMLMEIAALELVQLFIRPRFVLTGACHKCGACCRQLLADPPGLVKSNQALLRWFIGYHRARHNFYPVARGPDGEIIFACGHLRADGRCSIYRHRPLLCRNYPVVPIYEPPRPLPGCGFSVAPRVVAAMQNRASLPIVNPEVVVHHPTPMHRDESVPEDFRLVDPMRPGTDVGDTP